jgi:hypothetical protein
MTLREPILPCLTERLSIRLVLFLLPVVGVLPTSSSGWSQLVPGSMDVHWNEGAPDCAKNQQPALQVHPYNSQTLILRENPCALSRRRSCTS